MSTICQQLFKTAYKNAKIFNTRSVFHWVNLQFNALDEDRVKLLGPDRTCAEWILRNGGGVKFSNHKKNTDDYNELPDEEVAVHLEEIYAINCSIMRVGFEHFRGCNNIKKIIFRQCDYLEENALMSLKYVAKSLQFLEVSRCYNINDQGLLYINVLKNLKTVTLSDLPGVKDKNHVLEILKADLPQASITFN